MEKTTNRVNYTRTTPEAVAALSDAMASAYPAEMYNYYFGGENEDTAHLTYCAVDMAANAIERLMMTPTANASAALSRMLAAYIAHTPQDKHTEAINAVANLQNILHTLTANADALHILSDVLNRVEYSEAHANESAAGVLNPEAEINTLRAEAANLSAQAANLRHGQADTPTE